MPHARQQIREAVATAVTGLASTGSRVFQSRMRPQDELPCLLVTTNDERILDTGISGDQQRELVVVIEALAKSAGGLDDSLDTIATEIETALGFNPTFSGLVDGFLLQGTTLEFDDSLEQPVGSIRLTYTCTYFTHAGAPGSTL